RRRRSPRPRANGNAGEAIRPHRRGPGGHGPKRDAGAVRESGAVGHLLPPSGRLPEEHGARPVPHHTLGPGGAGQASSAARRPGRLAGGVGRARGPAGPPVAALPTGEGGGVEPARQPPFELLGASYAELRRTLRDELLERVKACPPHFFERLVLDLLVAMGYG